MHDPATLELSIRSWSGKSYTIEPRYFAPGSEIGQRPYKGSDSPAFPLDLVKLREAWAEPISYGQALASMVFHDRRVGEALATARARAAAAEVPLRLRLRLDPDDPALHAIAWELLQDPHGSGAFSAQDRLQFSRYCSPQLNFEPPNRALPQRPLILVAVANPRGLGRYQLQPIDVEAEIARARKVFGDANLQLLVASPEEGYVTFTRLVEQLQLGADVLYLVCHGAKRRDTWDSRLWLENNQGEPEAVDGDLFIKSFQSLDRGPRLVVLTACQSAGDLDSSWILSALGSRLIAAGCPAVIASQGNLSMRTADDFFQTFFSLLFEYGQIERAVAGARAACQQRSDWWRPVLYTQISDDYLWRPDPHHGIIAGVPPVPAFYVRREQDESRLIGLLHQQTKAAVPINVYGLPGAGKTSLVAAVIDHLRLERQVGDAVIWGDLSRHSSAEQLWAFMSAIGGPRADPERSQALLPAFWDEVRERFRRPLIVLDQVDNAARAVDLLPNRLPDGCRVVLISFEPLRFVDRPDPIALSVDALDDTIVQRMFQQVLGAKYQEQFQSDFAEIGRLRGGLPQLILIDALQVLHSQVQPDIYRAELERSEQELRLADNTYQLQLDQALELLPTTQIALFELIGIIGEGSWKADLLAAATLRTIYEVEADLKSLLDHGLLSAADNDRYTANRLIRNYARSRFERRAPDEKRTATYLFARACLDLLADQFERIVSTTDDSIAPILAGSTVARRLVQQLSDTVLPELVHLRQALVWATQNPGWKLMERFARLAWSELLDDLAANAREINARLTLAMLRRAVFWYAGSRLQVRGRAALVSQPIIMRHPHTKAPLEIRDSYQYNIGDRLVWPRVGQHVALGDGGRPELSLQLLACRLVDAVICGYTLVESRWIGVLAEKLLLCDVDAVAAIWTNCDLRGSLWLRCDARQIDLSGSRLDGAVLEQVELRGCKLQGVDLRGATIRESDLRGADLTDADLRGANLCGIDLRGATLSGAQFDGAHIQGMRIQGSKTDGSSWRGLQGLPEVDNPEIQRQIVRQAEELPRLAPMPEQRPRPVVATIVSNPGGEYDGKDLRGIDLSGQTIVLAAPERLCLDRADLSAANLAEATLPWVGLRDARLRAANMRAARLPGADLRNADIQNALLDSIVLAQADLRAANLQAARLSGADLSAANLVDADLLGADLSNANLTGAKLTGANLAWADLRGARVEPEQLASANRLAYGKISVDNQTKDIKEFPGRYIDSEEGFDRAAFLKYSVCSGVFERWSLEEREMFGAQLSGSFTDLSVAQSCLSMGRLSGTFIRVCFCTARLDAADLSGDFSNVHFHRADLRQARLSGTFVNVSFQETELADCTIAGASFAGVNFVGASGLDMAQLRSAWRLRGSTLPDGRHYGGEFDLPGDCEDARHQGFDLSNACDRERFYT